MTRLLGSEIRRLLHRRIVLWMTLAMIGFVVTLVVISTALSKPDSPFAGDAIRTVDLWLRGAHANRLHIAARNRIVTVSVISYLLVVVIGASAVGAEYRAGTVTTILTWEPRRVRLLFARLFAAAVVSMLFFAVVLAIFVLGFVIGVALNGSSAGADGEFWRDLLGALGRGTVLAGVLAVISGALATLGKNTAAALGIWFGYLVAIEAILGAQAHDIRPWTLTLTASAFFAGETARFDTYSVGVGAGTLRLALYVVVIGAVAFTVFARRDVT